MADIAELMRKLHKDKITVSIEWLEQCVGYIRQELHPPEARLLLEIQEQWLSTDISEPGVMQKTAFPQNISSIDKFSFAGSVALQVNYGYDIGNSAYSQLQKHYKLENENARVSADISEDTQSGYQPSQGRFVASWEPKPSRMLKLALTDGFQTLEAVEHERIEALDTVIKPGMKIQLFGPLKIKKGKIYLRNNNIRVLGGCVDELVERFSTENVLSQKVGKRVDGPAFPFMKGAPKRHQLDLTKLSTQQSTQSSSQRPVQSSTQRPVQPSTQRPAQYSMQRPTQSQAGLRQIAPTQIQNQRASSGVKRPSTGGQGGRPRSLQAGPSHAAMPDDNLNDIDWDDDGFPDNDGFDDDFGEDDVPLLNQVNNSNRRPDNQFQQQNQQFSQPQQNTNTFRAPLKNISLPNSISSSSLEKKPQSVVRPLSRSSDEDSFISPTKGFPKKTIQTSISSFISSKKPKLEPQSSQIEHKKPVPASQLPTAPISVPDFDLAADMDFFDDDMDLTDMEVSQSVSSEPFVYLSLVKQELERNPNLNTVVSIKAVSATLVRGLKVAKMPGIDGPVWSIGLLINDGSDFLQVDMKGDILEKDLGSPSEYMAAQKAGNQQVKASFKSRMSELSRKIAVINGILKLRFTGVSEVPCIVNIEELSGLHVAKLRRRKLK